MKQCSQHLGQFQHSRIRIHGMLVGYEGSSTHILQWGSKDWKQFSQHLENILHLRINIHSWIAQGIRGERDLHSVLRKARLGSNEEAMFITLQAILTLQINRHSIMKCSGDNRRDERLTFCNEEARIGSNAHNTWKTFYTWESTSTHNELLRG